MTTIDSKADANRLAFVALMADAAPCPFCDGKLGMSKTEAGGFAMTCLNCWCQGPPEDTEAEAVAAWNLRRIQAREAGK